jgi:hypothetical protein
LDVNLKSGLNIDLKSEIRFNPDLKSEIRTINPKIRDCEISKFSKISSYKKINFEILLRAVSRETLIWPFLDVKMRQMVSYFEIYMKNLEK